MQIIRNMETHNDPNQMSLRRRNGFTSYSSRRGATYSLWTVRCSGKREYRGTTYPISFKSAKKGAVPL